MVAMFHLKTQKYESKFSKSYGAQKVAGKRC